MNAKDGFRLATSTAAVVSGVRAFRSARGTGDRLKTADAVLTLLSVAVTIAIIVREIRESRIDDEMDLT